MPVTIYIKGAKDPNEKYRSPTSVAPERPDSGVLSPTISLGQRGKDQRYARNDPNPVWGQTMRT
jgi:hypothetical protein